MVSPIVKTILADLPKQMDSMIKDLHREAEGSDPIKVTNVIQ
jgi:hypothetical protein